MTWAYHVVLVVGSTSFRWVNGLYAGPHRAMICEYVMFAGPAIREVGMLMNRVSARRFAGQSFRTADFAADRTSGGGPPSSWVNESISETVAHWDAFAS